MNEFKGFKNIVYYYLFNIKEEIVSYIEDRNELITE